MERPLEGVRVLDLSSFLSGPYATMLLGGMGAEVIKVERPGSGEPARSTPPYYGAGGLNSGRPQAGDISLSILKRCRNKQGVTLNLKDPEGRELLLQLAERCDVAMENFTPGTLDKLGVGPSAMLARNPRLIFCSISGFGQTGPYRDLPAFDPVVQAMSGAMNVTGFQDGPPVRMGIALGDQGAALFAVIGVLAALEQRHRTGTGQVVDVSMLDCLFSLVMDEALDVYDRAGIPVRTGNRRLRLTPFNCYRTEDGWLVIATAADEHWASLLRAMGREDLVAEGYYARLEARMASADSVDAFVEEWTKSLPTAEAQRRLQANRVACGPVVSVSQMLADPQLHSRGMVAPLLHPDLGEVQGATGFGMPIKFSGSTAEFDRPAPQLGQDNDAVYAGLLGLGADRLAALKAKGVI